MAGLDAQRLTPLFGLFVVLAVVRGPSCPCGWPLVLEGMVAAGVTAVFHDFPLSWKGITTVR